MAEAQVGCPPTEESLLALSTGELVPPGVEEHIRNCPSCQQRLRQLQDTLGALRQAAQATPAPTVTHLSCPEAPDDAGRATAIGKYLIVGQLGHGGQSQVYRALHPELNRELVIKVATRPTAADQTEHDLLVREGRVLADLE